MLLFFDTDGWRFQFDCLCMYMFVLYLALNVLQLQFWGKSEKNSRNSMEPRTQTRTHFMSTVCFFYFPSLLSSCLTESPPEKCSKLAHDRHQPKWTNKKSDWFLDMYVTCNMYKVVFFSLSLSSLLCSIFYPGA